VLETTTYCTTFNKMEGMCFLSKLNNGYELIFSFVPYCGSLWDPSYWVLLDLLRLATLLGKKGSEYSFK